MMMPTDQETTTSERKFVTHSSQEEGAWQTMQGNMGKHQGGSRGQDKEKCGQKLLLWFQQALGV